MPWKSKAQQRWGNSPAGIKALGGKKNVAEWNKDALRLYQKIGFEITNTPSTLSAEQSFPQYMSVTPSP